MKYPLVALEELRKRERDDAARELAAALSTVAECTVSVESAARAHQAALDALSAQEVLHRSAAAAGEVQRRVAYRERLVTDRDARKSDLIAAEQRLAEAQADAERARGALAEARAQHRAVELHHDAHRAAERAKAQAREDEAIEEAHQRRP